MTAITPLAITSLDDVFLLVYCLIDDLYAELAPTAVRQRPQHERIEMSDAEVLTLSVLQEALLDGLREQLPPLRPPRVRPPLSPPARARSLFPPPDGPINQVALRPLPSPRRPLRAAGPLAHLRLGPCRDGRVRAQPERQRLDAGRPLRLYPVEEEQVLASGSTSS